MMFSSDWVVEMFSFPSAVGIVCNVLVGLTFSHNGWYLLVVGMLKVLLTIVVSGFLGDVTNFCRLLVFLAEVAAGLWSFLCNLLVSFAGSSDSFLMLLHCCL